MNCSMEKIIPSDMDNSLMTWAEPELEIKLGEPVPSNSPNADGDSEFLNPWPYLSEFFKFVGFRGKDNVEFQCLFCMPIRKTLSTSIKSHANLKKHVGRVHSHVFEQYQQCVKEALNAYMKSRRGDPQVLEALEKKRVKQQLIIREALSAFPRTAVQSIFENKVDLEFATELALNPLHNKWMASELLLHPPADGAAVKSEPASPASPMPSAPYSTDATYSTAAPCSTAAPHSTAAPYFTAAPYSTAAQCSTAAPHPTATSYSTTTLYSTSESPLLAPYTNPSTSYNAIFPRKRKKMLDDKDKVLQLALQKHIAVFVSASYILRFCFAMKRVWLLKSCSSKDETFKKAVEDAGFSVKLFPSLSFSAVNEAALREHLQRPNDFYGMVFTSSQAVKFVKDLYKTLPVEHHQSWLTKKIFAVGEATAQASQNSLQLPAIGSHCGNAQKLAEFIISEVPPFDKPLLIPCSDISIDDLPRFLIDNDRDYRALTCYKTSVHPDLESVLQQTVDVEGLPDIMVFFSPSGVDYTLPIIKEMGEILDTVKFIALGPSTNAALVGEEMQVAGICSAPTPAALTYCLKGLTF
ncbi:Tetrapyrrole biosynthesis uroporphyrinogen III synthase [Trinorchestia longiramus]|nr:Tetrapyrrole biosynthesis uroporphyrinogen III synthase [Trinorchestia longiramus]